MASLTSLKKWVTSEKASVKESISKLETKLKGNKDLNANVTEYFKLLGRLQGLEDINSAILVGRHSNVHFKKLAAMTVEAEIYEINKHLAHDLANNIKLVAKKAVFEEAAAKAPKMKKI